jgi:NAD(P)-dependent dehydrogenase (short-subunit alcohol dehydrogenase family)
MSPASLRPVSGSPTRPGWTLPHRLLRSSVTFGPTFGPITHLTQHSEWAGVEEGRKCQMQNYWEGPLDLENLMSEKHYNAIQAYRQSNTARLLFTLELAKRLTGTMITANTVTPGFARTNLGRDAKGPFKLFLAMMRPFMISPEKGADTSVYLASAPEVAGVSSRTFANRKMQTEVALNETNALHLWQISAELTGLAAQTPANY